VAIAVAVEVGVFAVELAWYLIAPSVWLNNVSYVACMLLAPSFVTMIACTPLVSREGGRSFTRAALGLAAMYGVLCAGKGAEKVLKVFCAINGFLAVPTVVFPAMRFSQSGTGSSDAFGVLVLLFWCIIFLPIPITFARLFRGKLKQA
jgi:hypothetical protein